ncbi:MAG: sulfite exporter TauE/SafE family protein [Alphaproteobacteria bacterium]|nr:sulfite exporter TauE/SafE family protein [Alphaproteobacteria bacterium]
MIIENHIYLWALVGMASGTVLGLAGTGGGVIAIPILMAFGGYDIKEASGYGLLALTVGAAISWFMRRENTIYPITAMLIVCAGVIAFISAPLKTISPHWLVSVLLNLTCIFSLYSLWVLRKPGDMGENRPLPYQLKTASMGGAITGFMSTMTGLGGGVVVIPWLTGITRLSFDQAMACSLLTIAVTAPISAWRQDTFNLGWGEWIALASTIALASVIVKKTITYIPLPRLIVVRKLALTAVICIAMTRTLYELF